MTSKQHTWGQYATPTHLADLLLGFCVRRPADRLLDPSCGAGALLLRAAQWQRWLASAPADLPPALLTGVELDAQVAATAQAQLPQANILPVNFFTLEPDVLPTFDAIIGNPPYTRAEWIGRLDQSPVRQLSLLSNNNQSDGFLEKSSRKDAKNAKFSFFAPVGNFVSAVSLRENLSRPLVPPALQALLGGRAGLYAYFFLHSAGFLRENGRLGFIVPNSWLDVAYGQPLKQFLLDHFRLVTIIESNVERWFDDARVNTCLVVLEKCTSAAGRNENLVRLVQLNLPLQRLLGGEVDGDRRVSAVEQLLARLLPATDCQTDAAIVRVQRQGEMAAGDRWGVKLRAPALYFHLRRETAPLVPLRSWASIRRGFTTGANTFFYLDEERIEQWGIEPAFRRPALKSLRHVQHLRLNHDHRSHDVLIIPGGANLAGSAVARYLAWGESEGIHRRHTCAARQFWYVLPEQATADLVLAKGIWRRHFTSIFDTPLLLDQQLYGIYLDKDVPQLTAAALLNSAWFALQCELQGRVNFGEGVLWLASYELEDIRLPDPRHLTRAQAIHLAQSFARLAERPLGDTAAGLFRPDRQQLDEAVFDVLGVVPLERAAVREALLQRITARTERAGNQT